MSNISTSIEVELLNQTLPIPDLTFGQAMDIAKIPERYNEKRISALIAHLTGNAEIAKRLTVQERYFYLLNYHAVAESHYSLKADFSSYFIAGGAAVNIPESYNHQDILIEHLYGAHVEVLEGICENACDWVTSQMACQLSGDVIGSLSGGDAEKWESISGEALRDLNSEQLKEAILSRHQQILDLPEHIFNKLESLWRQGQDELSHLVEVWVDNTGLVLMRQGGEGDNQPARFLALSTLRGAAKDIAGCFAQ